MSVDAEIRALTADWDETDWEIAAEWLKAMTELPGALMEVRWKAERAHWWRKNGYKQRMYRAVVLLHKQWEAEHAH